MYLDSDTERQKRSRNIIFSDEEDNGFFGSKLACPNPLSPSSTLFSRDFLPKDEESGSEVLPNVSRPKTSIDFILNCENLSENPFFTSSAEAQTSLLELNLPKSSQSTQNPSQKQLIECTPDKRIQTKPKQTVIVAIYSKPPDKSTNPKSTPIKAFKSPKKKTKLKGDFTIKSPLKNDSQISFKQKKKWKKMPVRPASPKIFITSPSLCSPSRNCRHRNQKLNDFKPEISQEAFDSDGSDDSCMIIDELERPLPRPLFYEEMEKVKTLAESFEILEDEKTNLRFNRSKLSESFDNFCDAMRNEILATKQILLEKKRLEAYAMFDQMHDYFKSKNLESSNGSFDFCPNILFASKKQQRYVSKLYTGTNCKFFSRDKKCSVIEIDCYTENYYPSFVVWTPIEHNLTIPKDQRLFDFIPYFGDRHVLSADDELFLANELIVTDTVDVATQIDHQLIADLIILSQEPFAVVNNKLLNFFHRDLNFNPKQRIQPAEVYLKCIFLCFPIFNLQYLQDIFCQIKKHQKRAVGDLQLTKTTANLDTDLNYDKAASTIQNCFGDYLCRKCLSFCCYLHNDIVFPRSITQNNSFYTCFSANSTDTLSASGRSGCGPRCFSAEPKGAPLIIDLTSDPEEDDDDFEHNVTKFVFSNTHLSLIKECLQNEFSMCETAQFVTARRDQCAAMYRFCIQNASYFQELLFEACEKLEKLHDHVPRPKILKYNPKHSTKYSTSVAARDRLPYLPCWHPGKPCDRSCPCVENGLYCEKYCFCDVSCCNRFAGCSCNSICDNTTCPCYQAMRECDPDVCRNCFDAEGDCRRCRNNAIQFRRWKQLVIGRSHVAGLGVFAGERIKEHELIAEYAGEHITAEEGERRGRVYDEFGISYLFDLTRDDDVDSNCRGTLIRFANHSSTHCNAKSQLTMCNGEYHIGIYASRSIAPGEEILFDYYYSQQNKKFVNK